MKDAKYLIAYLLPLSALLALLERGEWAWATVVLSFGIIPTLEFWLPQSTENVPPEQEASRSARRFFDALLALNLPLLFGIVGWYLYTVQSVPLKWAEYLGLTLSAGIVVGAVGINVAHELGHRASWLEQLLAKWMLLPALYQHFFIEHNRGHHKNVATELDPASARLGEPVYRFWLRSIGGSWHNAWRLERERLAGRPFWSLQNEMLRFQLGQAAWLLAIVLLLGWKALAGALVIALIGILLLETINYIEHYGLRRRLLPSGRPEPVRPAHSWNSNHELGRIFLYELTRHSDHHYKSTRKYQVLRHMDESPQLPFGYPASLLLALAPPLWFRVMHPLIDGMEHRPSLQDGAGL
ncbi:MAG: alkane 1-monooxygenase [Saprospiraceae bacterium]|nr:alkane 1-monooxygenase [Saprospiraceae bacterium]